MWPFKRKEKDSPQSKPTKPKGLLNFETLLEKFSEGVDYKKYRVELHIKDKKGITKEQLESLLVYSYESYYNKLVNTTKKIVAVTIYSNQDKQVQLASIVGRDSNPEIKFSIQTEGYLNDKPSFKNGMSYTERQEIYRKTDEKYMKAMHETNTLYETYVVPPEKEEAMKFFKQQSDYLTELENKYIQEVANAAKITVEEVNEIFKEGYSSGWPKSI